MADQTEKVGQYVVASAVEQNMPFGSPPPVYSWTQTNPSVANLNDLGSGNCKLTGISVGQTVVTATDTANGNLAGTGTLTVNPGSPPSLTITWNSPT